MQSYGCVHRAYGHRRRLAQEEFAPVLACLQEAVRRDPEYSEAWAMLGWAYLDAGRYGYGSDADPASYYPRAIEAASRSLDLEPTSMMGLKALSAINFFQGNRWDGGLSFAVSSPRAHNLSSARLRGPSIHRPGIITRWRSTT